MFNLIANRFIVRLLAVIALAGFGGVAYAAPVASYYHVVLDTSAYAGTGWLDLQFNPGMGTAPYASATLSNFAGAIDGALLPDVQGAVSGSLAGTVRFENTTAFNALFQALVLGGGFSFDLSFAGAALDAPGAPQTLFSLALYGTDQMTALGNAEPFTNSLLRFDIGGGVLATVGDADMAQVTAVPEPGTLLLMVLCMMVAVAVRRRAL